MSMRSENSLMIIFEICRMCKILRELLYCSSWQMCKKLLLLLWGSLRTWRSRSIFHMFSSGLCCMLVFPYWKVNLFLKTVFNNKDAFWRIRKTFLSFFHTNLRQSYEARGNIATPTGTDKYSENTPTLWSTASGSRYGRSIPSDVVL